MEPAGSYMGGLWPRGVAGDCSVSSMLGLNVRGASKWTGAQETGCWGCEQELVEGLDGKEGTCVCLDRYRMAVSVKPKGWKLGGKGSWEQEAGLRGGCREGAPGWQDSPSPSLSYLPSLWWKPHGGACSESGSGQVCTEPLPTQLEES